MECGTYSFLHCWDRIKPFSSSRSHFFSSWEQVVNFKAPIRVLIQEALKRFQSKKSTKDEKARMIGNVDFGGHFLLTKSPFTFADSSRMAQSKLERSERLLHFSSTFRPISPTKWRLELIEHACVTGQYLVIWTEPSLQISAWTENKVASIQFQADIWIAYLVKHWYEIAWANGSFSKSGNIG